MTIPFTGRPDKPSLFLTADYELFLGRRTGDPKNCMVDPTEKMCRLLESFQKSLILFVDVPYLHRLGELSAQYPFLQHQYTLIQQQLKNLLNRGHRIELHIHPQWLNASFQRDQWSFQEPLKYKLRDLDPQPDEANWQTIVGCVTQGRKLLEDLAREEIPDYRITCFRAGGFSLQPFNLLRNVLLKNEVSVDSTVAPGLYGDDGLRVYDFRHSPQTDSWSFDADPCQSVAGGPFKEMPIATFVPNWIDHWNARFRRRLGACHFPLQPWGDGIGLPTPKAPFLKRLQGSPTLLTYDYWDASTIIAQCRKKFKAGFRCVTLLGHPKFLSSFGLEQLRLVLEAAKVEGWV